MFENDWLVKKYHFWAKSPENALVNDKILIYFCRVFGLNADANVLQFEDGYLVETVVEGNELGTVPYAIRVSQDGELFAVDAVNSNIVRITPPLSHCEFHIFLLAYLHFVCTISWSILFIYCLWSPIWATLGFVGHSFQIVLDDIIFTVTYPCPSYIMWLPQTIFTREYLL